MENTDLSDYLNELKNNYEEVVQDIKKVFIFIKKEVAGGCDGEYNDCLWDCIADSVARTQWGERRCQDAAAMKKFLGLPRKAMIPVAMIPAIEKNMDIMVNVHHTQDRKWKTLYKSTFDSAKGIVIDVRLQKEHYSLLSMEELKKVGSTKWLPRGASLTPKVPLYYTRDESDEKFPITAYLPSNPRDIQYRYWALGDNKTKGTFEWHKAWPRSSPFSLVNVKSLGEMEEHASYWKRCQKALYEATDGEIDLSKYTSFKQAALYLWRESCPQYDPEPIEDEEAEWLVLAKNGMTIWWKGEKYEGHGVQQDMNGYYIWLLSQCELKIPMKKPTYHTYDEDYFDNEENRATYGIYRAEIEGDLFLFNHQVSNCYTSFCIMYARQRGLKVRMIQDGKPNAMVYETGKAAGSHMFKGFADRMQDLKRQGVPGSKDIMRVSLGGLGQKNKKRLNGKPNKSFECFENRESTKIC